MGRNAHKPDQFFYSAALPAAAVLAVLYCGAAAAQTTDVPLMLMVMSHPAFIAALFACSVLIKSIVAVLYTLRFNAEPLAVVGAVAAASVVSYPAANLGSWIMAPSSSALEFRLVQVLLTAPCDFFVYRWLFAKMHAARRSEYPISQSTCAILAVVSNIVVLMLQPFVFGRLLPFFTKLLA